MNQNENDPLTAEELYDQKQRELSPCVKRELRLSKIGIINLMEEYAAQQVEQQTKQLKEERDKAVDLLGYANKILCHEIDIQPNSPLHNSLTSFLDQLNQQNEG